MFYCIAFSRLILHFVIQPLALAAIVGVVVVNVMLHSLSRVSILLLTRDIDIVILSVCPSVCP